MLVEQSGGQTYESDMDKITIKGRRSHTKASEKYVDVVFRYPDRELDTSVPIEYRRTGTLVEEPEIETYLGKVYAKVTPALWSSWVSEQKAFWESKPNANTTRSFFDILSRDFAWHCVSCDLPANPNFARRIQDLKEFGYTLSTDTNRRCAKCRKGTTHLILLPLPRGGITGYETWSPELRKKIIRVLGAMDAYEAKVGKVEGLLPDHKFPEIRWDDKTRRESLEHLTDTDILADFQLLSNQRNQQKREACRLCYQTGKRGVVYGIPYFYEGSAVWNPRIPKVGKAAEAGCRGCAWYDLDAWRKAISRKLSPPSSK